ncbi:MAG: FAD-dependent oxidoreductase [Chlamydiae bacterium]|nr:FAD-dependent oxidoreductase [Chlamydiota bacterium]
MFKKKLFKSFCFFFVLTSQFLFNFCHSEEKEIRTYPVIILGGGIGGLTSAIYLQRAGIPVLVIEGNTPGGAIAQSPLVQNWPGEFEITGIDLIEKVKNQALFNGAIFTSEEVIGVDFSSKPLKIWTRDLDNKEITKIYETNACIIALGTKPNFLGIPGELDENGHFLKGVHNCATCDGFLFQDKTVAVIGGGDSSVLEAHYLSNIAKEVHIIVRGKEFQVTEQTRLQQLLEKSNVHIIYHTKIEQINRENGKISSLVLKNRETEKISSLNIDGVFLAIGSKPNSEILSGQLDLDTSGYVILKKDQETSKKGVFAVGDIADAIYKQAISAAGDGAKAAMQVEQYLSAIPKAEFPQDKTSSTNALFIQNKGIIEIEKQEELQEILSNSSNPVLVEFYSPSCPPCKKIASLFEEKANQYSSKFQFVKVDGTQFSKLLSKYDVEGFPTLIVFKNNRVIEKKTGMQEIRSYLNNLK